MVVTYEDVGDALAGEEALVLVGGARELKGGSGGAEVEGRRRSGGRLLQGAQQFNDLRLA